jgi:transcription factor CON7
MPLHSNHANNATPQSARSNNEMPIDPSIAASPTYPPQPHYPAYQTQPDMYGAGHPGVYGRPEWAGGQYAQPPPIPHYGHPTSSGPPSAGLVSPVNRPPAVRPVLG